MARLENDYKLGYFATPPCATRHILQYLTILPGTFARILDPCCGRGIALGEVKRHLEAHRATVDAFGVEVSSERAADAKETLGETRVLDCAWEAATTSTGAHSLVWDNPPYTHSADAGEDGKKEREELRFLRAIESKIMANGVLVFIIPQSQLGNKHIARHLATKYQDITIRSFSDEDGEYEKFKQVVVFGIRKRLSSPNEDMEAAIIAGASNRPEPLDTAEVVTYTVPAATLPAEKFTFRKSELSREESVDTAVRHGAYHSNKWRDLHAPALDTPFQPVTPLRLGHIGSLISSGQIGTVNLGAKLMRGTAVKTVVAKTKEGQIVNATSDEASVLVDRFDVKIFTVNQDGDYEIIDKPEVYQTLLEEYNNLLLRIVTAKYQPLYETPTPEEWAVACRMVPYKRLPGRKQAGLLNSQKHVAIAAARVAGKKGVVFITAEQGSGKTKIGTTSVEVLYTAHKRNPYPCLVMCPAHLTSKWPREIMETIPGCKAVTVRTISELERVRNEYRPGQKLFVVASMNILKSRSGLRHLNRETKRKVKKAEDPKYSGTTTVKSGFYEYAGREYRVDNPGAMVGMIGYWDQARNPDTGRAERFFHRTDSQPMPRRSRTCKMTDKIDPDSKLPVGKQIHRGDACPKCGQPVAIRDVPTWCQTVIGTIPLDKGKTQDIHCGEPLFQFGPNRKWALAEYIVHQMPGFFKTLIADEVHKFKAKGSDQGRAFQILVNECKYVINLTGTLFGGKSTDLFYLLYRTDPEIRKMFKFDEEINWSSKFGRLQVTLVKETEEYGQVNGKRRHTENVKELPGISPAIFKFLLDKSIFLKVNDLGFAMPGYEEDILRLVMSEMQASQYEWLYSELYDTIIAGLKSYNRDAILEARRLLSVWLQNCLGRVNSGFRTEMVWKCIGDNLYMPYPVSVGESATYGITDSDEAKEIVNLEPPGDPQDTRGEIEQDPEKLARVMRNGDEPMVLYPIVAKGELLPKEEWLAKTVAAQKARGRKTIIYVRQTDKRNIQPRLAGILNNMGVRAIVLPSSVDPSKREAWIEKHAVDIDALICNPRKVETGLDLVMFSTCIFYELDYSLFVLLQAMRRVWRLGQTDDVEVIIPVYVDTMEEAALVLMANKASAANLLYGESAQSALAAESDTTDIMAEMTQKVLAGTKLQADGIQSLLKQMIPEPTVEATEEIDLAEYAHLIDEEERLAQFEGDEDAEPAEMAEMTEEEYIAEAVEVIKEADAIVEAVQQIRQAAAPALEPKAEDGETTPYWELWKELDKQTGVKSLTFKPSQKRGKVKTAPQGQLDLFSAMLQAEPDLPQQGSLFQ